MTELNCSHPPSASNWKLHGHPPCIAPPDEDAHGSVSICIDCRGWRFWCDLSGPSHRNVRTVTQGLRWPHSRSQPNAGGPRGEPPPVPSPQTEGTRCCTAAIPHLAPGLLENSRLQPWSQNLQGHGVNSGGCCKHSKLLKPTIWYWRMCNTVVDLMWGLHDLWHPVANNKHNQHQPIQLSCSMLVSTSAPMRICMGIWWGDGQAGRWVGRNEAALSRFDLVLICIAFLVL